MRNDPESRSRIHIGSIVQILPGSADGLPNGVKPLALMVVDRVESFGPVVRYPGVPGIYSLTWDKIAWTGGDVAFTETGDLRVAEAPLKHHP